MAKAEEAKNALFVVKTAEARRSRSDRKASKETRIAEREALEKAGIRRVLNHSVPVSR